MRSGENGNRAAVGESSEFSNCAFLLKNPKNKENHTEKKKLSYWLIYIATWKSNENIFLKNKYVKTEVEERIRAFICGKDIISLKTEHVIDLDRINLTNRHEQKLLFTLQFKKQF